MQVSPWPVQQSSAASFVGMLYAARYKASAAYLSSIITESILLGFTIDPYLQSYLCHIRRVAKRNTGPKAKAAPIPLEVLKRMKNEGYDRIDKLEVMYLAFMW